MGRPVLSNLHFHILATDFFNAKEVSTFVVMTFYQKSSPYYASSRQINIQFGPMEVCPMDSHKATSDIASRSFGQALLPHQQRMLHSECAQAVSASRGCIFVQNSFHFRCYKRTQKQTGLAQLFTTMFKAKFHCQVNPA